MLIDFTLKLSKDWFDNNRVLHCTQDAMWSRLCSLYSLWTFCTKGVVFHVLQHSLRSQTRAFIARFLRPSSSSYPQAIGFAHTQFGSRCIPDYINYAWTLMTSQSSLCFASHSHAFHAVYSFLFVFVLKLFSFHFPFFYSCRSLTLATYSISAFKICAAVAFAVYVPFVHYNETTCMCACIWCSSKTNRNSNRHKFRFIWHATTWSFRSKSLQSTAQQFSVSLSVEKLI